MLKFIVGLTILLVSASAADARGRHRHHSETHLVWNWNHTGFWQPLPGTTIERRTVRHRRHFARAGVARHAHVRTARHIHARRSAPNSAAVSGSGVVKTASGAVAYVASRATEAFQCVIDGLEKAGYPIKEIGGFASRGHIRHSLHYSGLALDINQQDRNVTVPPMPKNEIEIANRCGLISGAQWAGDPDSGHFQLGGWSGGNTRLASRHRHHVRYAFRSRHVRSLYASARLR